MDPLRPTNAKDFGYKKSIRSYTLLAEYIDAKQRYSCAKNRLNRFCSRERVSYNEIRSQARKPATWLSFLEKSRRFKTVRDELLRALNAPATQSQEIESLETSQDVKHHEAFLNQPSLNECWLRRYVEKLENLASEHISAINQLNLKLNAEIAKTSALTSACQLADHSLAKQEKLKRKYETIELELHENREILGEYRVTLSSLSTSYSTLKVELEEKDSKIRSSDETIRGLRAKLASKGEETKATPIVEPVQRDNPSLPLTPVNAFVKRSHRDLKDLEWRKLLNLKFKRYVETDTRTKAFNSIIGTVQQYVVYSNDAVAEGILGNYFSNQIREAGSDPQPPSSSKR